MSAAARSLLGPPRRPRSPIDIVHAVAAGFARPDLSVPDLAGHPVQRWCNGVDAVRDQARSFADFWREHNRRELAAAGPLWVVLGDSTALGLGASAPLHGYVGRVHVELVGQTGRPWRVVDLSRAGALASSVLARQLPQLDELPAAALVTLGVGSNDILVTPPRRLCDTLRTLIARLPDRAVVLDLPLPNKFWVVGGVFTPRVARVNRAIDAAAMARGLPVAYLSRNFTPPWSGKFAADRFHPSDLGYQLQAQIVLEAVLP